MQGLPTVYVVILNWNGWQDTLRCLQSVLASSFVRVKVIVCDNGSEDGSVERILEYLNGQRGPSLPAERAILPPPPGLSSTLWMVVPTGM